MLTFMEKRKFCATFYFLLVAWRGNEGNIFLIRGADQSPMHKSNTDKSPIDKKPKDPGQVRLGQFLSPGEFFFGVFVHGASVRGAFVREAIVRHLAYSHLSNKIKSIMHFSLQIISLYLGLCKRELSDDSCVKLLFLRTLMSGFELKRLSQSRSLFINIIDT